MATILEKRRCLHRNITSSRRQNEQLESQVAHLQALANIGTVSSMIAHEMNNILTPLANYAQLAINNPSDASLNRKALEKTLLNAGKAAKILESLMALVNGEKQDKKNCRLTLIVEDIFTCMCRDFLRDKIVVDIQIPEQLDIWAVPVQIQQVLMNLILNARDAMLPGGGRLTITASESDDAVYIEIADSGRGIASENIERIFEPFFTTKNAVAMQGRGGAGMGLAFCKYVVDAHDGAITVNSREGHGATFKITLPKPQ